MNEKQYVKQVEKVKQRAEKAKYKQEIIDLKKNLFPEKHQLSTSKKILIGATLLTIFILGVATTAIFMFQWEEALIALVGAPATLIPVYWRYFAKAEAENTAGGITYETAMLEIEEE